MSKLDAMTEQVIIHNSFPLVEDNLLSTVCLQCRHFFVEGYSNATSTFLANWPHLVRLPLEMTWQSRNVVTTVARCCSTPLTAAMKML